MNKDRQQETKKLLLEQLRKTPIVQITCERVGISRATFYRWKKEDSTFSDTVDDALSTGVQLINDMAESQLISAIRDKNMTAIIYWLKNRHKDYSPKLQLSGNLTMKHRTELTDEQKTLIQKALQLANLNVVHIDKKPYEKHN